MYGRSRGWSPLPLPRPRSCPLPPRNQTSPKATPKLVVSGTRRLVSGTRRLVSGTRWAPQNLSVFGPPVFFCRFSLNKPPGAEKQPNPWSSWGPLALGWSGRRTQRIGLFLAPCPRALASGMASIHGPTNRRNPCGHGHGRTGGRPAPLHRDHSRGGPSWRPLSLSHTLSLSLSLSLSCQAKPTPNTGIETFPLSPVFFPFQ